MIADRPIDIAVGARAQGFNSSSKLHAVVLEVCADSRHGTITASRVPHIDPSAFAGLHYEMGQPVAGSQPTDARVSRSSNAAPAVESPISASTTEIETQQASTDSALPEPQASEAPTQRMQFLAEVLKGRHPVHRPDRVLDAIKLRCLAQDHYDKNEWNKLVPGLVMRFITKSALFKDLASHDYQYIKNYLVSHPGKGSRTLLKWLYRFAFLEGLGKDPHSFMSGEIRRSILAAGFEFEQLHTTAGRIVQAGASGVAFGMECIPVEHEVLVGDALETVKDAALEKLKLAMQNLASVLPTFIVNPILTGWLRSNTDVFQKFKLKHGMPTLSEALSNAKDMDDAAMRAKRMETTRARVTVEGLQFREADQPKITDINALTPPQQQAVRKLINCVYEMYEEANDNYKLSMGSYKASASGKMSGAVIHAAGSGVTALSYAQLYEYAFYLSLGLIVAQPVSGMYDLNTMATYYLDAGIKWDWKSLIAPEFRHLPAEELEVGHLKPGAAVERWDEQTEIRVKAVRESYRYEISKKLDEFDQTLSQLEKAYEKIVPSDHADGSSLATAVVSLETLLKQQCRELEHWRRDIDRFESFDAQEWKRISPDRVGRYIDRVVTSTRHLAFAQRAARTSKPGEVLSQVTQRAKQLTEDGPLSYAALYAVAKILDGCGISMGIGEAILSLGAANWALNTSQTRADKANDKRMLDKPLGSPDAVSADVQRAKIEIPEGLLNHVDGLFEGEDGGRQRIETAGRWAVNQSGKEVPLTGEAGYRKARPDAAEHARRYGKVWKYGMFSGFRAGGRLINARRERGHCAAELDAVILALERLGFASTPGPLAKGSSMAGKRARLEEFDVVKQVRWRAAPAADDATAAGPA